MANRGATAFEWLRSAVITWLCYTFFVVVVADMAQRERWAANEVLNAFAQDQGREAVPRVVQEMRILLYQHSAGAFRLSTGLADDPLLRQRATEFLYPAREDIKASHVLALASESVSPACRVVGRAVLATLYECP